MKFQQFCLRLRHIEIEICTLLKKDKTSKAKLSSYHPMRFSMSKKFEAF